MLVSSHKTRWIQFLQQFNITYRFLPGPKNPADVLSRNPHFMGTLLSTENNKGTMCHQLKPVEFISKVKRGYLTDPWYQIQTNLDKLVRDGDLWRTRSGALCIPSDKTLRDEALWHVHDARYCGHPGVDRTVEIARRHFWWPTLIADVRQYVGSCLSCLRNKSSRLKPAGLYQPLPVPAS